MSGPMEAFNQRLHPPNEFLPVAQSSGEMVRLGRQIMSKAIEQAAWWLAEGLEFGRLGLNASAQ